MLDVGAGTDGASTIPIGSQKGRLCHGTQTMKRPELGADCAGCSRADSSGRNARDDAWHGRMMSGHMAGMMNGAMMGWGVLWVLLVAALLIILIVALFRSARRA